MSRAVVALEGALTVEEAEARFPSVAWREPLVVSAPGVDRGLVCRLCVATFGLSARFVAERALADREAFDRHFRDAHTGGRAD